MGPYPVWLTDLNGNPSALLVGMQTATATAENSMKFAQKSKNGTAFWPSNSTAGIIT